MLVQNSVYVNRYIGNGVATKFAFQFPILDAAHLKVVKQISAPLPDGVVKPSDEVIVPATEYTVTGVGVPDGGEVTFKAPPASGEKIALVRDTPITQLYQYTELDSFPAESHENALAKLTLICQELAEELSRAIVVGVTDGQSPEDYIDNFWKAWEEVLELYVKIQAIMNNLVCQTIEPFTTQAGVRKYYVGDGLPLDPKLYNLFLTLGGVAQEPKRAFTIIDESHIEFTENPPAGLRCWGISTISTSTPDLRQMVQEALTKLAYATTTTHGIMMVGDGLSVLKGRVSVDFSQMPTDKFEALMKQIRVPIWLPGNKSFFVNWATGSDVLDDKRGESADKPFRTLQAALNYVTDNYNMSRYVASINIAPGYDDESDITLPLYNATTGGIEIVGNSENYDDIKLGRVVLPYAVKYDIWNVRARTRNISSGVVGAFEAAAGTLNLSNCCCDMTKVYDSTGTVNALYACTSGFIRIWATKSTNPLYKRRSGVFIDITGASLKNIIQAINNGQIQYAADITFIGKGTCTINLAVANLSYVTRSISSFDTPGRRPEIILQDGASVTGKRYSVTSNSIVSMSGAGQEAWPGTEAGSTSTGGQYF